MKKFLLATLMLACAPMSARADDDDARFEPLPRRDTIRPMEPDWCRGAETSSLDGAPDRLASQVSRQADYSDDEKTQVLIARAACAQPDDPKIQALVARYRQRYVNRIGTSEADDHKGRAVRASRKYDALREQWCRSLEPGDEASPEEKAIVKTLRAGTGCSNTPLGLYVGNIETGNIGRWIDRTPTPPLEIVRAVYVLDCMRLLDNPEHDDWPNIKRPHNVASFGACYSDVRRLDKDKLERELADTSKYAWNDYARTMARETFAEARTVGEYLAAEFRKKAAKDPAYQKLLFDAPEQGWKEWEAMYAANKDAYDAAREFESRFLAGNRKSLAGCGAKLRPAFNAYVRSKKPKTPDEARRVAQDPIGLVLLESLILCDGLEGRLQASKALSDLVHSFESFPAAPERGGPRMQAYAAQLAALSDIIADRENFPVKDFSGPYHSGTGQLTEEATHYWTNKVNKLQPDEPRATIQSITPKAGGLVHVTFKATKTMILNRVCTPNKRILAIKASGEIVHDSDCRMGNPPRIPITSKEKPLDVPAQLAGGLKAGMMGHFAENDMPEPQVTRDAVPREVWDAAGKKLVNFYGVPLQ